MISDHNVNLEHSSPDESHTAMIDLKPLQISRIFVLHYLLLVEMRLKALETVADDNDTHIVGWTINVDNKTNLRQPPENCAVQTKNKKLCRTIHKTCTYEVYPSLKSKLHYQN